MKRYLFSLSFLLITSEAYGFGKKPISEPAPAPAPVPKPSPTPKPTPSPALEKTCPAPGSAQAVDLSMPVDQAFLDAMKQLQVSTVIRYYDHVNETIRGKTLKSAEVDLLARNGFDLMVVFQHNNNAIASFTAARGAADGKRSLDLAAQFKQPKGSAVYFGVDGSWSSAAQLTAIRDYFGKAGPLVRDAGYKIGAYGSGLVCSELLKTGHVDFCWLANATGWPGYTAFKTTNAWTMAQGLPKDCGGKNADFNVVNSAMREMGSWRP